MRTQHLALASILWLSLTAGQASAQQAEWEKNQALGRAALADGNLPQAADYLEKALKSAEQLFGKNDSRYPALMVDLAATYEAQKDYPQAEDLLKRAVAVFSQDIGASTPDTADHLLKLGKLYQKDGKTAEAKSTFEQALAIYEKWHTQNNDLYTEGMATALDRLGVLYAGDGNFDKAEASFKRCLAIRESVFGKNSVEVGHVLRNYSDMLRKSNRLAEATQMSDRAETIQSQP